MSKAKTVSLFDIKISKASKEHLKILAIKEKITPDKLLETLIERVYEEFYIGNNDLSFKGNKKVNKGTPKVDKKYLPTIDEPEEVRFED